MKKVHISGIADSMAKKKQFDFTENGGKQPNEIENPKPSVSLQIPLHVEPQQKEVIGALHIIGLARESHLIFETLGGVEVEMKCQHAEC